MTKLNQPHKPTPGYTLHKLPFTLAGLRKLRATDARRIKKLHASFMDGEIDDDTAKNVIFYDTIKWTHDPLFIETITVERGKNKGQKRYEVCCFGLDLVYDTLAKAETCLYSIAREYWNDLKGETIHYVYADAKPKIAFSLADMRKLRVSPRKEPAKLKRLLKALNVYVEDATDKNTIFYDTRKWTREPLVIDTWIADIGADKGKRKYVVAFFGDEQVFDTRAKAEKYLHGVATSSAWEEIKKGK